jgi:hypothetical protein
MKGVRTTCMENISLYDNNKSKEEKAKCKMFSSQNAIKCIQKNNFISPKNSSATLRKRMGESSKQYISPITPEISQGTW